MGTLHPLEDEEADKPVRAPMPVIPGMRPTPYMRLMANVPGPVRAAEIEFGPFGETLCADVRIVGGRVVEFTEDLETEEYTWSESVFHLAVEKLEALGIPFNTRHGTDASKATADFKEGSGEEDDRVSIYVPKELLNAVLADGRLQLSTTADLEDPESELGLTL